MRVYLGSDHAGFELKAHLVAHLASLGHEAIDVGPPTTTPRTTTRRSASRPPAACSPTPAAWASSSAARATASRSRRTRCRACAPRWPGASRRRSWPGSTTTRRWWRIGARMHSLEEAAEIVAAFVATPFSGEERHQRRIDILAEYERTGVPPALPEQIPDAGGPHPAPAGPAAPPPLRRASGRGVQPAGPVRHDAEVVDGRVLSGTEAHGKHLFHHYGPDLVVHVHLGLYGRFSDLPLPAAEPRGLVRMRMVGPTHYADLRGPTACELITDVEAAADPGPARRRTRCAATPTRTGPGPGSPGPGRRWPRC